MEKPKIYKWSDVDEIVKELKNGKCLITRTDTIFGILSLKLKQIYCIKKRPQNKKVGCFISNVKQIPKLPKAFLPILSKHWPGPYSFVVNNISYRIPKHSGLLKIIKKCKKIYQSSANISGCQVIDNIDEAIKIFAKSLNKIIFIQTPTYKSKPATIVDLDKKKIIRDERNIGNKILNELKYITLKKCKK